MTKCKNYGDFLQTLVFCEPPTDWPEGLQAMWWDVKNSWKASHTIAQETPDKIGSWIHAYLHRKEGDGFNAGYWYRKAHKPIPSKSLEEEQREIIEFIISRRDPN